MAANPESTTKTSRVRMNFHKECEAGINKQINLGMFFSISFFIEEFHIVLLQNCMHPMYINRWLFILIVKM